MNVASIAKHDDLVLHGKCPYSEFFGPNAEKYGRRKTPNTDTFHAV